jgi:hypothetical protein
VGLTFRQVQATRVLATSPCVLVAVKLRAVEAFSSMQVQGAPQVAILPWCLALVPTAVRPQSSLVPRPMVPAAPCPFSPPMPRVDEAGMWSWLLAKADPHVLEATSHCRAARAAREVAWA